MTMTTSVRINAPINPIRVLDWLTEQVGGDPVAVPRREGESYSTPNGKRVSNEIGLGLMALCDVEWCEDGMLPTRSKYHEDDEPDWPAAIVEASFDTAYGFQTGSGATCGDLHAYLLTEMAAWLADQGITDAWWYAGEYVSEWAHITDLSEHDGEPGRFHRREAS